MNNELSYWIAISHLPRWTIERINQFIVSVIRDRNITWNSFFGMGAENWYEYFPLTEKEIIDLKNAQSEIARYTFIAEQLLNEGYNVISINSESYPKNLIDNLTIKSAPPLLYLKGRVELMNENITAIVGSRKASNVSLEFTDIIAKKCAEQSKVVVSGYAKGVDQKALESCLENNGKSIIVLPQGILTFQTGYKKYYQEVVNGNLLILSTFFPSAGWDVGLAMARNTYIYGLADEIYVAESDTKGGTWQGVKDGIRRSRKIFIRYPEKEEENANKKLIEMGAIPVDMTGKESEEYNLVPSLFG